jgi:hypothetical protein
MGIKRARRHYNPTKAHGFAASDASEVITDG